MMAACGAHLLPDAAGGDVVVERLGDGTALLVRSASPMNKAIGFGFDGRLADAELDRVEAIWQQRRVPLQCEVATLARCEVFEQLSRRGYALRAFENVLGCAPAAAARAGAAAPFAVERVGDADAERWIECLADGFLSGDGSGAGTIDAFARTEITTVLRQCAALPGVRRYAVRIDGAFAGGAGMRIGAGRTAQLTGAATLPRFRRRGVQQALLAARLCDAAAADCDVAVITTQPGSISQQNAARQGFALIYARAIMVRPA